MAFDGEKLRLGRLFYGWAQADLGVRVGASRQFIHQLELEAKEPSAEMRRALSAALNVYPIFFESPLKNPVKPEQAHFRQLRTTPLTEKRQVLAHVTFFERLVECLEERFQIPAVSLPVYEIDTVWAIDRIADDTRQFFGLGQSSPIKSMSRVLENAGVIVANFECIGEKVDALSVSRSRPIVIRSNMKQSVFRQRFDYAHELGHLIMHQGVETGDRETEGQAHRFAGAFLMPREAVMQSFPKKNAVTWDRIFSFKLKWGVSAAAVMRRLYDLGVVDAAQYRLFNIKLVKTGQKKRERYDDDYPLEAPEIVPQCVQKLLANGREGITSVCRELGVCEVFLARLVGNVFEPEELTSESVVPFPGSLRGV